MFFFSSRRRHTRLQGDWSSDVCSSDLCPVAQVGAGSLHYRTSLPQLNPLPLDKRAHLNLLRHDAVGLPKSQLCYALPRSEERRVGKSVDLGGRRIIKKKKRKKIMDIA